MSNYRIVLSRCVNLPNTLASDITDPKHMYVYLSDVLAIYSQKSEDAEEAVNLALCLYQRKFFTKKYNPLAELKKYLNVELLNCVKDLADACNDTTEYAQKMFYFFHKLNKCGLI